MVTMFIGILVLALWRSATEEIHLTFLELVAHECKVSGICLEREGLLVKEEQNRVSGIYIV